MVERADKFDGYAGCVDGDLTSLMFWCSLVLVFTARCTMHSAKRGLAIACRPSVTLVICDHIGWKSWKLIARTISPAPSLFVTKRRST